MAETRNSFNDLVTIMARLRDPQGGCEWDLAQTFASIAPYTIEEAYEVADAIARGSMPELKDELGDLLLQVVFHARMAEEADAFAIEDVIKAICDKMVRRHPHIFDQSSPNETHAIEQRWEEIKAAERGDVGVLDGVALALPALLRAQKIQKRAARVGFDWPDASGAEAKIIEELDEAEAATSAADVEDEVGDLLFAVVNYARHRGVDPETALRGATAKFERRFRHMEKHSDQPLGSLTLESLEELWATAKRAQASSAD